jgi:hypothetical protein
MSFVKVYFDFEERTEMLNEVEQGRLLLTMLRYAQGKTLPELKGNERFLFPVFKADIDRDAASYNAKVSNGAKGGRPKSKTEENLTEPNITEYNLNPKNKNKNKNKTEEQDKIMALFSRFWSVYPNKVKKSVAEKSWVRLAPDDALTDRIVADVERRVRTEWTGEGAKYVPHPTTYLNQRRWEDETEVNVFGANREPDPIVLTDEERAEIDRIYAENGRDAWT